MSEMIGHNGGPTFDDIIRENFDSNGGLLVRMKEVIVEAVRDPRLERRHLRVLAEVLACLNSQTGIAYPGRATIAANTRKWNPTDGGKENFGYTDAGISKTLSELVDYGYLVSTKRAIEKGGKALTLYTIRKPSVEELQDQITDWIMAQRLSAPRRNWTKKKADSTHVGNSTHVRGNEADSTSESTYVHRTVTNRKELHTNIHTIQSGAGAEIGSDEGALDPKIGQAATMLAVLVGSETDPDHDRAMKLAEKWAKVYSPEDVLDAVMDYEAKRADRSEYRPISEQLFGSYVRQAKINREKRASGAVEVVEKLAPRELPVGEIENGIVRDQNGDITLVNGVRDEWLERFGGNERLLSLALIRAGGEIRPNSTISLGAQIKSALAHDCRDIILREQNTAKAVDRRESQRRAALPVGPAETVETRSTRYIRKIVAMGDGGKNE